MATSFVPAPKDHGVRGTPVEEWVKVVWDHARFTGPHAPESIVFRDVKPVLGRPGAFFATPVTVAPFRPAILIAVRRASMETLPGVRHGDVVVPLGKLRGGCPRLR